MNLFELFYVDQAWGGAFPVYDCDIGVPVVYLSANGMETKTMIVDRITCKLQPAPITEEQLTQAMVLLASALVEYGSSGKQQGQIKSGRYIVVSGKEEFKQYTNIFLPELDTCALLFPAESKCGALFKNDRGYSLFATIHNLVRAETPEDLMAALLSGGANV